MSLRSLFPCPSCQKRGSSYIQANAVISSPPLQFVCVCVYWLCNQSVCLYVSHTGVCVSVERLQGVQHTIHQSELAAEAHADPQRGQAIQGEHARTHNSPVSHESEYLLTTWTTCNSVSLKSLCIMWVDCEWCVFLQCVVGGCNATFASQGGLARHVPTHFSSQSSSKVSNQGKVKEESPSKAGLNKRRKLKNKQRRSLRMYKLAHTSLSGQLHIVPFKEKTHTQKMTYRQICVGTKYAA